MNLVEYLALPKHEKLVLPLPTPDLFSLPNLDSNEPLVDVRELDHLNRLRYRPDLESFLLRLQVARQLCLAGELAYDLGYGLEIYSAYRPISLQRRLYAQIAQEVKAAFPELSSDALYHRITQQIADPDGFPPHCCGAAINIRLYRDGELLDMGVEIWKMDDQMSSPLSPLAQAHRAILKMLMLQADFAPYALEWWHFSYGDYSWGAFYNRIAMYGVVKEVMVK